MSVYTKLTKIFKNISKIRSVVWGSSARHHHSSVKASHPLVRVVRRRIYQGAKAREVREVTCAKRLSVGPNQPLRHLKGAETWFQYPPILLRVRS